nr:uncharacterized protein LOC119179016 [Rhipicephalus microplus]
MDVLKDGGGGGEPRLPGRRKKKKRVCRGEPGCGTTGKTVANRHGDRVSGPPARLSQKVQSPNCVSRGGKNRVGRGGAKNRVCRGGTKPRQPGRRENCVSRGERKKKRVCRGEPGCGTTGKTVANRHGDRVSGPPARLSQKVQSPNCVSRGGKNRVSRGGAKNRVCRGGTKPRQPGRRENCVSRGERKKKTRLPGQARVRHHRENCGKQTWRSSEWAASQAQPKSAKSEPCQPGRRKNRVCRGGTKPRQPGRRENCVSRGEPGCGTTGKTVANRHGDRVSGPPARHSRKVLSPNCVSRGGKNRVSRGGAKNRVCRGECKKKQRKKPALNQKKTKKKACA